MLVADVGDLDRLAHRDVYLAPAVLLGNLRGSLQALRGHAPARTAQSHGEEVFLRLLDEATALELVEVELELARLALQTSLQPLHARATLFVRDHGSTSSKISAACQDLRLGQSCTIAQHKSNTQSTKSRIYQQVHALSIPCGSKFLAIASLTIYGLSVTLTIACDAGARLRTKHMATITPLSRYICRQPHGEQPSPLHDVPAAE